MPRIDAHQHFWKFDPVRDAWIGPNMKTIAKDFMPEHLKPNLDEFNFDGCVVVQSSESLEENLFQLENAEKYDFIKGIVGWVDLRAENLEEQLQEYQKQPLIKGFRHILQGESDRATMLQPKFKAGLKLLNKYNFTYDVLIFPDQILFLDQFLTEEPEIPMVLDHLAKPAIKSGDISEWKKTMQHVAKHEQLYCKVSGMVTEADWEHWKYQDFEPYLDVVFNAFGTKRLMFGSDWPVCNLAGGFQKVFEIAKNYTAKLTLTEQADFWGENAARFYHLT